jgi:hypothetical protein
MTAATMSLGGSGRQLSIPGAAIVTQPVAHRIQSTPAWRLGLRNVPHSPIVIAALLILAACIVVEVSLGRSRTPRQQRQIGAA